MKHQVQHKLLSVRRKRKQINEQPELRGIIADPIQSDEFWKDLFLVRPLENAEKGKALQLAWKVFCEYESPDYAPEGTEEFKKCLNDDAWDKEYNVKYARLWQTMKPETPIEEAILANGIGMYAICSESENGFAYWIAGLYQGGEVPEGLELYSFPASEWAVFSTKGPMPCSLQTLNTYVWQEWFPTEGKRFQANGMATLEVYSAGDPQSPDYESGIWVPVKEA